ncbi:MAG: OsmC family protein [Betaproteobacteria bacterium]
MSKYTVAITWKRDDQVFVDNKFRRLHTWTFDGGIVVPGSSSPHLVPVPESEPKAVDPEEAFVAALSSCHMLWFLYLAARQKYCVDSYSDESVGTMAKNAAGKLAMTRIVLRPRVAFSGDRVPDQAEFVALHHDAHAECFIANSVTTDVVCEPLLVS